MEVSEKTDTYAKEDKEGPLSFILNLLLYVGIALFIRFFILNISYFGCLVIAPVRFVHLPNQEETEHRCFEH